MSDTPPDAAAANGERRRRLRAVFAADVANFGGLVSVDETKTLDALWNTRRIATEELATSGGWLFGMPGDGLFALFESAVDAVRCALRTQSRLTATHNSNALTLRIGVHLGEVLFKGDVPGGETLVIAARLESLAKPGGILVSSTVKEAVEARISATFGNYAVHELKHIPRRIGTFTVSSSSECDVDTTTVAALDRAGPSVQWENKVNSPAATGPAAKDAVLPKVTPLVLPGEPLGPVSPEPDPSQQASTPNMVDPRGIASTCLVELTRVLTTHVGPVAKVLVKHHAAKIADPTALIAALVQEIPAEGERLEFIARARAVVGRRAS
jgi:class 3 adenylate cyclase